jgi:hypothetical protein
MNKLTACHTVERIMRDSDEYGRYMDLADGETRWLAMQADSMLVPMRGRIILTEGAIDLGDACFRVHVPLEPGCAHRLTYGGYVALYAEQAASVRCIAPGPGWMVRLLRAVKRLLPGWRRGVARADVVREATGDGAGVS